MKPFNSALPAVFATALLLLTNAAPAASIVSATSGDGVRNDLFDISRFTVVINTSPMLACCGSSFGENALGGTGGVEGPHTLFADGGQPGDLSFIDFKTATPLALTSFVATLADDSDDPGNFGNPNRGSSSFTLYSSADETFTQLTPISTTLLPSSYLLNYSSNAISITDTFPPVTAQFFRIEVTRTTAGGPRIREVDGFGTVVPEPGGVSLIAAAFAGLAVRRRR